MTVTAPTMNLPTPAKVAHLQALRHYPSVTVLMTTREGSVMSREDAARLDRLVAEAVARLRAEEATDCDNVSETLRRLQDSATAGPTRRAVALFASRGAQELLHLPVDVHSRVVVDPTFATRDLVRALHRTPRHAVLALSAREARLFEGNGEQLRPVTSGAFPLVDLAASRIEGHGDRPRREHQGADVEFLRCVDAALGVYLRLHPTPLVLAGDDRTTAAFRRVSRHLARLAGTVNAALTTPLPVLAPRVREMLAAYLRTSEAEALPLVDKREGSGRVVWGIRSAWLAARAERPEMLAVEESFFYPARLSADGDYLLPADDVDHPDVIDDIVDELIENVLQRGAWVAIVSDGTLAAHDSVALTLCP